MAAYENVFLRSIRNVVGEVLRDLQASVAERALFRLDWLLDVVNRYADSLGMIMDPNQIQFLLREARDCLCAHSSSSSARIAETVFSGQSGRPRYRITEEQLQFLIDRRFTVLEIASMLGVGVRTVERRMNEFRLSIGRCYSTITDTELDSVVDSIIRSFPNTGYKRMSGFLMSRGLRVQQDRIRCSMHRVHPEGCMLRALEMNTLHRRRYRVYGPLALWHIDGNHKLIRYLFFF